MLRFAQIRPVVLVPDWPCLHHTGSLESQQKIADCLPNDFWLQEILACPVLSYRQLLHFPVAGGQRPLCPERPGAKILIDSQLG